MDTSGKPSINVDNDTRKEIAAAVADVPWIGPLLAFFIRRGWWATVLILVLFFLVVPFVTPLLSAAYVKVLPRDFRDLYARWVIDAYGEPIKIDIDAAVRQVVDKNNANLDFVQQFRAEWSDPSADPARFYRFPLKEGQEFMIEFRPEQAEAVPCNAEDPRVGPADDALDNDDLFQISINRGAEKYAAGVRSVPENKRFGKAFWEKVAKSSSSVESSQSDAGSVEIRLPNKTAQTVLPCYKLAADLRVIVYKTIDPTDSIFSSASRTPSGSRSPEAVKHPGEAE